MRFPDKHLLRNSRNTECGAKQFLIPLAVRTAPFALLRVLKFAALCFGMTPLFAQSVITTIAGTDWLFPGNGQPALNAPLSSGDGLGLTVDANGNYYIADIGNLMAMRVGSDGILNVIAGNGVNFVSGDGGLGVNASLLLPCLLYTSGPDSGRHEGTRHRSRRFRSQKPPGVYKEARSQGDQAHGASSASPGARQHGDRRHHGSLGYFHRAHGRLARPALTASTQNIREVVAPALGRSTRG